MKFDLAKLETMICLQISTSLFTCSRLWILVSSSVMVSRLTPSTSAPAAADILRVTKDARMAHRSENRKLRITGMFINYCVTETQTAFM